MNESLIPKNSIHIVCCTPRYFHKHCSSTRNTNLRQLIMTFAKTCLSAHARDTRFLGLQFCGSLTNITSHAYTHFTQSFK